MEINKTTNAFLGSLKNFYDVIIEKISSIFALKEELFSKDYNDLTNKPSIENTIRVNFISAENQMNFDLTQYWPENYNNTTFLVYLNGALLTLNSDYFIDDVNKYISMSEELSLNDKVSVVIVGQSVSLDISKLYLKDIYDSPISLDSSGNYIVTHPINFNENANFSTTSENIQTVTGSNNVSINLDNGNIVVLDFSGNSTVAFNGDLNLPSDRCRTFTFLVKSNGYSITWPSYIKWDGGTAPEMNESGNANIVTILKIGSDFYGLLSGSCPIS